MSIERNLKLVNFFSFLSSTWFFIPVLLPYCKDVLGVGYQGMLMSEAIFAASCVVFDVPTGWISDVWRRKHSLVLGACVVLIALAVLLCARGMVGLFLAQLIFGIGICLFNGTHTALLYDTLLTLGRETEYRRREGKRQALSLYGIAFAGFVSGLLYKFGPFVPVVMTAASYCVLLLVVLAMVEPERHKLTDHRNPLRDVRDAFRYILQGHQQIGIIVLLAALLYCFTKTLMWAQQPYFAALGLPVSTYGILMAIGWLLGGMSSHMAHMFDGKVNNLRALALALATAIGVCLVSGLSLSYFALSFLILGGTCLYGTITPRVNEIINKNVDSSRRATVLSMQTVLWSSLFVPVSSLVGFVTDTRGIQPALLVAAGCLTFCVTVLAVWKRRLILAAL